MILTLDGIDGVGKTTIAELLRLQLGAVIIKGVRDPYIDKLANESSNLDVRFLYYLASFLDSILNARTQFPNSLIIFDKSFYSTIAYHKCLGSVLDVESTITKLACPDIKIFLTCPQAAWKKRLGDRQHLDWYEQQLLARPNLSEMIEASYVQMGLVQVVNLDVEITLKTIKDLIK